MLTMILLSTNLVRAVYYSNTSRRVCVSIFQHTTQGVCINILTHHTGCVYQYSNTPNRVCVSIFQHTTQGVCINIQIHHAGCVYQYSFIKRILYSETSIRRHLQKVITSFSKTPLHSIPHLKPFALCALKPSEIGHLLCIYIYLTAYSGPNGALFIEV